MCAEEHVAGQTCREYITGSGLKYRDSKDFGFSTTPGRKSERPLQRTDGWQDSYDPILLRWTR